MYSFSNKIIINNDKVFEKNSKVYYQINKKMNYKLKKYYDTKFDGFDEDGDSFLLENNIVIKNSSYFYNPFVVENKNKIKRVFIQLTEKCNLKCGHCYVESGPKKNNKLNSNDLKKLINKAVTNGVTHIDFTGGEIFTYNELFSIFEFISQKPVFISLFTNLTMLNFEQINELNTLGIIKTIITSIDYSSQEKHDNFRGKKGSFKKTMSNIDRLKKLDFEVKVNGIIMNDNHKDAVEIQNYFNKKNVPCVFDNIMPEGRKKQENLINNNVIENALMVATLKNMALNNESNHSSLTPLDNKIRVKNCGVGTTMIYITCFGDITLCPSLVGEKYKIGNLKRIEFESLEKEIENIKLSKCKNKGCEVYERCKGGCVARALKYIGDINTPDPISCIRMGVDYYKKYI